MGSGKRLQCRWGRARGGKRPLETSGEWQGPDLGERGHRPAKAAEIEEVAPVNLVADVGPPCSNLGLSTFTSALPICAAAATGRTSKLVQVSPHPNEHKAALAQWADHEPVKRPPPARRITVSSPRRLVINRVGQLRQWGGPGGRNEGAPTLNCTNGAAPSS